MKRGLVFGAILVAALAAFELFNFSTTEFALNDFLGAERFLGLRWATILAIAFCGIDFAGLARLFTPHSPALRNENAGLAPEHGDGETVEVWYLLGAWFLGATLNAMATWWAVTLALLEHDFGNEVLDRQQLLIYVPLFVAALVWLTRILIIGTFSVAGDRLFSQTEKLARQAQGAGAFAPRPTAAARAAAPARIIGEGTAAPNPAGAPPRAPDNPPNRVHTRPAPKPVPAGGRPGYRNGDSAHADPLVDDGLAFARRAAGTRQTNGVNGPKTIE